MAMSTEERLGTIERAIKDLAFEQMRTSREMREFKDEMREFKDEMADFKDEMRGFKEFVRLDIEESRENRKKLTQELGQNSNRWGTFTEDFVIPNVPRIAAEYFGMDQLDRFAFRMKARHPTDRSRRKEFDVLAWDESTVLWVETKAHASASEFSEFLRARDELVEYLPEVAGRKVVQIAAALSIPADVVTYLTAHNCYALALGDDTMEILNAEELKRR